MKQKHTKKIGSFLLAGAIVLTMFPTFHTEVHAAENQSPTKEQFSTVDELKSFNTDDKNDNTKNPARVFFGNDAQVSWDDDLVWWIVGNQDSDSNSMTLFSASPLAIKQKFEPSWSQDKTYSEDWKCDYTSTGGSNPTDVYPNHYGASPLRKTLKASETDTAFFSIAEQGLMLDTKIYTNDTKNSSTYSTTNKLYLAYGNPEDHYITAGKNNPDNLNNGLRIDRDYWLSGFFWLRAPDLDIRDVARVADTNYGVRRNYASYELMLMPAFELDLSSVIFASVAPAASLDGKLSNEYAFTLRYDAGKHGKNLGSALVSYDKSKVTLTNVPTDKDIYLVAQNSNGAYAKQITNETAISANDMGLDSFNNCKVWLETTDTTNRITYATLATEKQGYNVNITTSEGLTVTNGMQGVGQGTAIADIIVEVADGYFLPEDYIDNLQTLTWNELKVTKTDKGFKISGTPTSDVNITLPAATKKVYNIAVTGNGTFTTVCKDYQPITANEFTITNNGNVDLKNVNVSISGNDADKFELSLDKTTTIQQNGTIKVTVKPTDDLGVGTYQAELSVSVDKANTVTTDLQFTVNEHDYDTVVTPPTCTEKGYTTYACKKCNHSYVGDEVAAKGHTFGEWKVIKDATTTEVGIKERYCVRCNYKETENIPVISKPTQPNDSHSDKDHSNSDTNKESPKTGDQTNVGLFTLLLSMSALVIAVLTVCKKKKGLEHK